MSGLHIGIDPGKKGFSSELDAETGRFLRADVQPLLGRDTKGDNFDYGAMIRLAERWKEEDAFVVLEELTPMGGKMGTPQVHFFQGGIYFLWRGILAALKIRHRCIPKGILKKTLNIKTPSRIPRKPEPAPLEEKRPKKPAKKASDKKVVEWQKATEAWDAEKAVYDQAHKAWRAADRARLTRWKNQVKAEAVKVAVQYFPDVDLRRTPRCTTVDDNKAESILYAIMASKVEARAGGVV